MTPEAILDFWFGPPSPDPFADGARWWRKDPAFDAEIAARFGPALDALGRGELDAWRDAPRSCLAFIVLADQMSRNARRGTAAAFADDARALEACERGIDRGLDRGLGPAERAFFYMPRMHAEDLATQDRGIIAFATLAEESPEALRPHVFDSILFAVKHRKVIARFGRFPHRNAMLGRPSTDEEIAFLAEPGSSF